jgi:Ca2+-binding EF-hand superfamily protein
LTARALWNNDAMIKQHIAFGMLVCALASSAGLAPVAAQTRSAISDFHVIDTDHDRKLDRHELAAAAAHDFERLDIDHDGYLTHGELDRTRDVSLLLPVPGHLNAKLAFAAADTDRDHKIDQHEYVHAIVAAYMSCDRNHDGTIEVSDLRHCRV